MSETATQPTYLDTSRPFSEGVKDLVRRLTLGRAKVTRSYSP